MIETQPPAEYSIVNNYFEFSDLAIIGVRFISNGRKKMVHCVIDPEFLEDSSYSYIIERMLLKEKVDRIRSVKIVDYWRHTFEEEDDDLSTV